MKIMSATHHQFLINCSVSGLLFLCLTYPIQGRTGELDTYHYKLEENNNDKVCSHMAGVFSKYFKKPFSTINDEAEYVKGGGVLPPLLPGAKDDLRSFVNMRLSFQPTSPEFDAIKWQVGKQITRTAGEVDVLNTPFIAADVDLNNDGQIKTIIKHAFMGCYIPDPRCDNGQTDVLSIFRKSDIDLMTGPIEWNAVFKGQNGHTPLAVIFGEYSSCELMRPFVYAGVTYLSCYHQEWVKDYLDFRNNTPDKEYTDILKYQGVKDMGDGRKQIKAETVCRFRMKVTQ